MSVRGHLVSCQLGRFAPVAVNSGRCPETHPQAALLLAVSTPSSGNQLDLTATQGAGGKF
jgi:hypothetical protein